MQSVEKIRLPNMFAVSIRKHSVRDKNAGSIYFSQQKLFVWKNE